jgi:Fur family ferric uptake transcriptional regulator
MDADTARFKALLKKNRYFATKARVELFELLQNRNAIRIKDLLTLQRHQDQASVYRNIKVFEELGIINRLQLGWHSKLELSDTFQHHHHHLTCLKCGLVISLPEDPILEKQIGVLTRKNSFKATDHQLEIRGLCTTCR